jgi:hypothetical protein
VRVEFWAGINARLTISRMRRVNICPGRCAAVRRSVLFGIAADWPLGLSLVFLWLGRFILSIRLRMITVSRRMMLFVARHDVPSSQKSGRLPDARKVLVPGAEQAIRAILVHYHGYQMPKSAIWLTGLPAAL